MMRQGIMLYKNLSEQYDLLFKDGFSRTYK